MALNGFQQLRGQAQRGIVDVTSLSLPSAGSSE
jgi:hypothetical protein